MNINYNELQKKLERFWRERGSFNIGVIHRLLPSSDGVARKAEIKFLDDPQGKNILVRALKSLAPLERTTQFKEYA